MTGSNRLDPIDVAKVLNAYLNIPEGHVTRGVELMQELSTGKDLEVFSSQEDRTAAQVIGFALGVLRAYDFRVGTGDDPRNVVVDLAVEYGETMLRLATQPTGE